MQYDVFISYSSVDQKIAEGVCAYLEQHGIRCFVAYRDIPRGVVWAGAIVEALENSRMMLVLFSKHFNNSQQVDREIELAAEQRIPILTFRLSNDDFTGAKKYYLKNLHWIDAFPNPERYFGSLKENVCRLLEDEVSANTQPASQSTHNVSPQPLPAPNPIKRWLWLIIFCMIVALVVLLWPKGGTPLDGGASVKEEIVETLPPSSRQNDTGQQTGQTQQQQTQQPQQSVGEEHEAPTTPLYVTTTPSSATVYVDGKKVGTTPIEDKEIPRGSHKVKLSKEGYEDKTFTRTFGDKAVVLNETLAEKPKPQTQVQSQTVASSSTVSSPSPITGKINGHEWVDLGLSVKWGTCNVGASSPSDYGNYYAWGETSTKSEYLGFNTVAKYGSNCKTDGKSMGSIAGNASYDVARANWGGTWRLPTKAEFQELKDKCVWVWTFQDGHNGYNVTSKNGKSIFLPAAGWRLGTSLEYAGELGYYWSATPREDNTRGAYKLYFRNGVHRVDEFNRYYGLSVRPVSD